MRGAVHRIFGALGFCLVIALANPFGAAVALARTAHTSRVVVPRVVVAGGRLTVKILPSSSAGRLTAQLQEFSGRHWILRDATDARGGRLVRLWFRAPATPGAIEVRVALLHNRRVFWHSRAIRSLVERRGHGNGSTGSGSGTGSSTGGSSTGSGSTGGGSTGSGSTGSGSGSTGSGSTGASESSLTPGEKLSPGSSLVSPNGQYKLVMQASDGNLVLYEGSKALWDPGPAGAGAYAVMQSDGNLVVYNSAGAATWNSNTAGFPGAQLNLQDDSNLVLYHAGHPIWDWGAGYLGSRLDGWTLGPGAYLLSPDHQYELIMQATDGNLVLYHGTQALWDAGPAGAGAYAVMQNDGNFVVYNRAGAAVWNSNTAGFPGANLALQDDSNLVLYHASHPIWDWSSGYLGNQLNGWTLGPGAYLLSPDHQYELIMQATDGNLVLYHGTQALWDAGPAGAGAYAVMQSDGNFVVYNAGVPKWNSQTAGYSGSRVVLQNDNNLVVYQGNNAIWDWSSGKLVGGGGSASGGSTSQAQAIVAAAASMAGKAYCFDGGTIAGPSHGDGDFGNGGCGGTTVGFDCTGLTLYAVYQGTGNAALSHSGTQPETGGGQYITNQASLEPGDIVYFGGSFPSNIEHAGVYAGNGEFWDANDYNVPVQLHSLAWEEAGLPFVGAVRYWH